ncbi:MAG: TatD family hydrolase [Pseudomonadales bacterium]|nr:TatD family hydrolase [Pseudomonadales bacterium]
MFVDSHCHLNKLDLSLYQDNLDNPVAEARNQGVSHILCIGIDLESMDEVIAVADRYDNVFATVGTHPLYEESREPSIEQLLEFAEHPKVIGIGETGLDHYYCKKDNDWQMRRFVTHIEAAKRSGLPLIIHTRDAREQTIAALKDHGAGEVVGVMHCFTESLEMAQAAVELGFYISISGIVTFRTADQLRAVVDALPLDRLLIETDAPWLAPVPFRGKENQPKYVVEVAKKIAEIKGVSVEEVAKVTTENFFQLFAKANKMRNA